MKRVFAPARECDAAMLKGKPAFTGQPPPATETFDHDFTKSYLRKLTHLSQTGVSIPGVVSPELKAVSPPPKKKGTVKARARKAPPPTKSSNNNNPNKPEFSLDVKLPTRKGGGPAPIGNPTVFDNSGGKNLSSSLKGMAGAYNPLPFNIVPPPPKRRPSHKSPKKSPSKQVSKEEIAAAAAAVAEESETAVAAESATTGAAEDGAATDGAPEGEAATDGAAEGEQGGGD